MTVQTGEEGPVAALARRLEDAYYDLTALTARHFGRRERGWRLTGVAGLDAPTMNRAVVEDADPVEARRVVEEAETFFADRDCAWSVVLSTFRPTARWHGELVQRGLAPTTTLDVMARPPGPVPGARPDARVREARPDEVGAFTEVLMDVFRMPRRFFPALVDMTDAWRRGGARLYLAEVDGEPVGTALLSRLDGVAGVYNVGTVRHARRQGVAKAIMARALEDAAGADLVTLQVAPEGFAEAFYLGLGFEQIYSWRFYQPRARGLLG